MRVARLAILILVFGFSARSAMAADSQPMGGTGGEAFSVLCPADNVLVGINGRSGTLLDRVRGMCAKFVEGGWTNAVEPTMTSGHGSTTGGRPFDFRCPTGSAVVGLSGHAAWYVDQITVFCQRLHPTTGAAFLVLFDEATGQTGNTATSIDVGQTGGPGGDQKFSPCTEDKPAVGIFGKAHDFVDRLGLVCDRPFVADTGPVTPGPRFQVTLVGLTDRIPRGQNRDFGVQLVNLGEQSLRQ